MLLALAVVTLFVASAAISPQQGPNPAVAHVPPSKVASPEERTSEPTAASTANPTGPGTAPATPAPPIAGPRAEPDGPSRDTRGRLQNGYHPPAPPELLTGYRWPLDHASITNGYGIGRPGSLVLKGRSFHDGIDIASWCGDPIVAAHSGVVIAAGRRHLSAIGWLGDLAATRAEFDRRYLWGQQAIAVIVDDGNGYRSVYLHLSYATVEVGERVRAGQRIGYEGSTGYSTGCHLHYALFSPLERATLALDPKLAKTSHLPDRITARIDPLLVLPPMETADIIWAWNAR